MRSLRRVALTAALAGSVLVTGGPADAAPAVDPEPNAYPIVLSGDFTGDGEGDLFFHSPSSAPDVLYEFNPEIGPDDHAIDIYTYRVEGNYRPVVGRFADDADTDDIFWYQPGAAADVIWDFDRCVGCATRPTYDRRPITVNGSYTPVAGQFFPGNREDVVWYGRGSVPDSIWDFNATCDSCQSTYHSRSITVNGAGYRPVVGDFVEPAGRDDVFWYNTTGTESMWVFNSPTPYRYTAIGPAALQVAGSTYKLAVADLFMDQTDDIVFVGPGGTADSVWDFDDDHVVKTAAPEPLNGAYSTVTGVRNSDFEVAEDFFVYDPGATAGRYYDIYPGSGGFFYDRYDFDPAPLTELPPAEPLTGATAAATTGRRWVIPMAPPG